MPVNEDTLFKILMINKKSEIGQRLGFAGIKSIADYKRKVPLVDYHFYEYFISRMSNGETNILTSQNIEYFGHTSGTTGVQKLIPVTKVSRRIASKYMALLSNKFLYDNFKESWNYEKGLLIASMNITTFTKSGIPICSATSGGMNGIKNVLPFLYTSPIEVMNIKEQDVALYLHLLFALRETRLMFISSVFISNVLDLFRIMEQNHQSLATDIRRGRISSSLNMDEAIRKRLNKLLSPNAGRADQLEQEFQKGFEDICNRIWPELSYIAAVTGANFSIYDEKVKFYTGVLPIYSPAYASTEAMIGINPYVDKIRYVIIPDTAFYEFIPIGDKEIDTKETVCLDELKVGEKYEIVITNYAGLYRYKLGDVVKVVGYYNQCPEIEFLFRKNQVLNMVSEKTNEEHLVNAMRSTMRLLEIEFVDYTTEPDHSMTPGRYVFYIELKNNKKEVSNELLQKVLDQAIRTVNPAYDRARSNGRLGMAKVNQLTQGTFEKIRGSLINNGVSGNQIKIPRVATCNKDILKILKNSGRSRV